MPPPRKARESRGRSVRYPERIVSVVRRGGEWLPWMCLLLTLGGFPASSSGQGVAQTGRVILVVADDDDRSILSGVQVLYGDEVGVTDGNGRLLVSDLLPGLLDVSVEHLGYVSRTVQVDVVAGHTVEMRVPLARNAVELEPIAVSVRSRVLELRGFYERRDGGFSGNFLTREDVEERDPRDFTQLVSDLPGVRVINGPEGPRVFFGRAVSFRNTGLCAPSLFLDGVKSHVRVMDVHLDPDHVEGLEVYTGAGVPGRFMDACGAILVWTRTP